MKKALFIHLGLLISFVILITVIKRWFSLIYWPFWVGGILGSLLPSLDHLIYVYFVAPQELASQRVKYAFAKKDYMGAVKLMYDTSGERTKLIFHTAYFQVIFMILVIFVFTSTGSLFGKGIVVGFSFHLLVDQLVDFLDHGGIANWFSNNPFISIGPVSYKNSLIYCLVLFLALVFLNIFF